MTEHQFSNPRAKSPSNTTDTDTDTDVDIAARIEARLPEWHAQKRTQQNIEAGNAHYNTPAAPPEATVFRPNRLLQCHRKQYYRDHNAPKESAAPAGLFFAGSKLEEELLLPYLREQVTEWAESLYVTNSLWIEETLTVAGTSVTIRGSTDPVVVKRDGTPTYVTEVKSKAELSDSPTASPHHRAQLHAYMAGLSAKHDCEIRAGAVIYVSRKTLEMAVVPVSFDEDFWEDIGVWMATLAAARRQERLPPADPEHDWECSYCSYSNRCGQASETAVADSPPRGFVAGVEYPRQAVEAHLEAYPDVALPVTLAVEYPDLAEEFEVAYPYCPTCETEVRDLDGIDLQSGTALCPHCAEEGTIAELSWETRL